MTICLRPRSMWNDSSFFSGRNWTQRLWVSYEVHSGSSHQLASLGNHLTSGHGSTSRHLLVSLNFLDHPVKFSLFPFYMWEDSIPRLFTHLRILRELRICPVPQSSFCWREEGLGADFSTENELRACTSSLVCDGSCLCWWISFFLHTPSLRSFPSSVNPCKWSWWI